MKAFTAYQPYAHAIVAGLKQYETRPRRTNIRGRVAVHAGRLDEVHATKSLSNRDFWAVMEAIGGKTDLPRGAVVGTVEIVDCVPVEELADKLNPLEKVLGDYSPGRFAWVLKNPVMFDTPIPARGQQGWWNWDERPAEIAQKIRQEIRIAAARLLYSPYTEFGVNEVNSAIVETVKQYCENGEIMRGPTTDCISLGSAPLEVLPFLPLAMPTLSGYGTYTVYRGPEPIGTVTYSGFPIQETPGTAIVGLKTRFTPAKKVECVELKITCEGKEGTQ